MKLLIQPQNSEVIFEGSHSYGFLGNFVWLVIKKMSQCYFFCDSFAKKRCSRDAASRWQESQDAWKHVLQHWQVRSNNRLCHTGLNRFGRVTPWLSVSDILSQIAPFLSCLHSAVFRTLWKVSVFVSTAILFHYFPFCSYSRQAAGTTVPIQQPAKFQTSWGHL